MPYAAMLLVVVFWGSAAAVGRSMGDVGTSLGLALWRISLGLGLMLLALSVAAAKRRMVGRQSTPSADRKSVKRQQSLPSSDPRPFVGGHTTSTSAWPPSRRHVPIWIAGVFGYGIMIWLFFAAARLTLSSHLVLILSMAPICTMLLDRMTGARGDTRAFLPALLSLIGIVVMVSPSFSASASHGTDASLTGDLLAILALLAFSAYTVMTKRYSRGMSAIAVNVHGMSAGLAVLWALLAITEGRPLPPFFSTHEQWLAIGYLGLASTGLAYLLYAWALSRMPMERIMPLIYLQPMVGVLLSVIWLGEKLTLSVTIGMCAIVGGLIWNHRYTRMPAQPATTRRNEHVID